MQLMMACPAHTHYREHIVTAFFYLLCCHQPMLTWEYISGEAITKFSMSYFQKWYLAIKVSSPCV